MANELEPISGKAGPRLLKAGRFLGNAATLVGDASTLTLDVTGNVHIAGSLAATGDVVAASDRALKYNTEVIERALDRLKYVQGYTFQRVDMPGDVRFAGLIAQEVQLAVPEAAHALQNNTLGIAYGGVCALLVQAVKELSDRVAVLEAKAAAAEGV